MSYDPKSIKQNENKTSDLNEDIKKFMKKILKTLEEISSKLDFSEKENDSKKNKS